MRRWASLVIALVTAALLAGNVPASIAQGDPIPAGSDWLTTLNLYRALAGAPPVTEDAVLTQANQNHAKYMVENGDFSHDEDPTKPFYTVEGDTMNNTISASSSKGTERDGVEGFMSTPFHAMLLLNPEIAKAGYGDYFNANAPGFPFGVSIGVGGLNPTALSYPYTFPTDGAIVPIDSYDGSEYPDPLTSCPGYQVPSGLPLLVMHSADTVVTGHSLKQGDTVLDSCLITESNYANPDAGARSLGRNILAILDTVIIVPKQPLEEGGSYTASVTSALSSKTWSFSVYNRPPSITGVKFPKTYKPAGGKIFKLTFTLSEESAISIEVLNSKDKVVANLDLPDANNTMFWQWPGRSFSNGKVVKAGTYRVTIDATDSAGASAPQFVGNFTVKR